ncbi:hypothetical protein Tco_0346798, partial [Tanacetum coccineum]
GDAAVEVGDKDGVPALEWRLREEIEVAVGVRCGGDEMDMMLMMA